MINSADSSNSADSTNNKLHRGRRRRLLEYVGVAGVTAALSSSAVLAFSDGSWSASPGYETNFQPGTVISAGRINDNFKKVRTMIDTLDGQIPSGIRTQYVRSSLGSFEPNGAGQATAICPAGTTLLSGGCNFQQGTSKGSLRLISSYPTNGDFNPASGTAVDRWWCYWENVEDNPTGATFFAFALCATPFR